MIVLGMSSALLFVRNPEGKQRNLLFYNSDDWFMDYFNTLSYIADRNPYDENGYGSIENKNYLPMPYMLLYPFSRLDDYVNETPAKLRIKQVPIISCFVYLMVSFGILFYLLYEGKSGGVQNVFGR